MKKISILLILIVASFAGFAQPMAGQLIQGSLVQGSAANRIKVQFKSSATYTAAFSNVYLVLQIPTSVGARPVIAVKQNYLAPTYLANFLPPVLATDGSYYTYVFSAFPAGVTAYPFQAGTPFDVTEFEVTAGTGTGEVRLSHLGDAGTSGLAQFYVEVAGNDNTNYTAMFFGPGATNGGNAAANSFVPVANVLLPLRIIDFKASRSGENGLLTWRVENETPQNSHFEIERSLNGTSFSKAGDLNVAGNGSSTNSYTFTDFNVTSLQHKNVIYYRLKQVDRDGQFIYSEVKSIRLGTGKVTINAFPNPASSFTTLTVDLTDASPITVNITDANGKHIDKYDIQGNKGLNQRRLDLSKYPNGSYLLRVQAADEIQTISLVKAQ